MDIVEFLRARIKEDADQASELLASYDGLVAKLKSDGFTQLALAPHFARHDPDRVLAECESKQLMLGFFSAMLESQWPGEALAAGMALRILALPYVDHGDYQEEWKV